MHDSVCVQTFQSYDRRWNYNLSLITWLYAWSFQLYMDVIYSQPEAVQLFSVMCCTLNSQQYQAHWRDLFIWWYLISYNIFKGCVRYVFMTAWAIILPKPFQLYFITKSTVSNAKLAGIQAQSHLLTSLYSIWVQVLLNILIWIWRSTILQFTFTELQEAFNLKR